MKSLYFAATLTMIMLATGCGARTGGITDDPSQDGTLVAAGSRWVQTRDIAAESTWSGRLEYAERYALPTVHFESMTMYMARFNMADPFYIDVHDVQTFEVTEPRAFEWPGTALANEILGLAVSPDQNHVAGVVTATGGRYLEVLELEAGGARAILSGFADVTGRDAVWRNNTTLVFAMDLTAVDAPGVGGFDGGIVAIDLSELMAGGPEGNVDTSVLVGFDASEWNGVNDVHSFALSPDRNRLAYTYGGDVWVKDLNSPDSEPRQLTTGPQPHWGAAFSPDGSMLAFVEKVEDYASSVFLIPAGGTSPVLIDSGQAEGRTYRLEGVVATDRILAWLP